MTHPPQLRDLAHQILFGEDLWTDKCVSLDSFADDAPGPAIAVPPAPGRSADIALHGPSTAPPKAHGLASAGVRGQLLHAMANHELQALELMALALLRFPDADPRFRRGLAHIMADEQRHLSLYVRRMMDLGVAPHDLPHSDFFWRALRDIDNPLTFVVQMGLVLEQANLDFAAHWSTRLRSAGDTTTADLLDVVYADEIGHVRHGVRWATRWKNDEDTLWDVFLRHTAEPMTPARATGPVFDANARRRAGLPDDFIARVQVWGGSRGRPADVWWFNPETEAIRNHRSTRKGPYTAPATVARLARDLAALPATLATAGDIVLVPDEPRVGFLAHRAAAGLPMVQLVADEAQLVGRTLGRARPWGLDPQSAAAAQARLVSLDSAVPSGDVGGKVWAADLARALLSQGEAGWSDPSVVPVVVASADEALAVATPWLTQQYATVLVKGEWSASGRERVELRQLPLGPSEQRALQGLFQRQARAVVGPRLARVADFSFHADLLPDGRVVDRGVVRFETDAHGRFRGAWVGAAHRGLDRALQRFCLADGKDPDWMRRTAQKTLRAVAAALHAHGYSGPIGVDALIHDTPEGLRLWPLVEVNARWTMGRVALALRGHVREPARLRLVERSCGHPAFTEEDALGWPTRDAHGHISGCPLWLTDPLGAFVAAVVEIGVDIDGEPLFEAAPRN